MINGAFSIAFFVIGLLGYNVPNPIIKAVSMTLGFGVGLWSAVWIPVKKRAEQKQRHEDEIQELRLSHLKELECAKSVVLSPPTHPVIIEAKRSEDRPGIGKKYFCEIQIKHIPAESLGRIEVYLMRWTPSPTEQINHHGVSSDKRIPTSKDFPIPLKPIAAATNNPNVLCFECFRMPREGSEPAIEIVSRSAEYLSFRTNEPTFEMCIQAKSGSVVLATQKFQIEIVRGSGDMIGYFKATPMTLI